MLVSCPSLPVSSQEQFETSIRKLETFVDREIRAYTDEQRRQLEDELTMKILDLERRAKTTGVQMIIDCFKNEHSLFLQAKKGFEEARDSDLSKVKEHKQRRMDESLSTTQQMDAVTQQMDTDLEGIAPNPVNVKMFRKATLMRLFEFFHQINRKLAKAEDVYYSVVMKRCEEFEWRINHSILFIYHYPSTLKAAP